MNNKRYAFNLLELSIVLVIMGLLISGVTAGKNLIKKSQIYSISKRIQELETAIMLFKDQYSHLPGDFNQAYYYLSRSNAVCSGVSKLLIHTDILLECCRS